MWKGVPSPFLKKHHSVFSLPKQQQTLTGLSSTSTCTLTLTLPYSLPYSILAPATTHTYNYTLSHSQFHTQPTTACTQHPVTPPRRETCCLEVIVTEVTTSDTRDHLCLIIVLDHFTNVPAWKHLDITASILKQLGSMLLELPMSPLSKRKTVTLPNSADLLK